MPGQTKDKEETTIQTSSLTEKMSFDQGGKGLSLADLQRTMADMDQSKELRILVPAAWKDNQHFAEASVQNALIEGVHEDNTAIYLRIGRLF